jgi:predicted nucleic acid-binding protein
VPLCYHEPSSAITKALLARYQLVVWWATAVEVRGGIARHAKAGRLTQFEEQVAIARFAELRTQWREVLPSIAIRERAIALVGEHELRAADSLQLAAALEWSGSDARDAVFITGDRRLSVAARRCGFLIETT